MAKRITGSSVNWSFVMETLTAADSANIAPFKLMTDKYLREISTKPAELPKIDWNSYKGRISTPGMVDSFQKAYEGLKVPYPSDQGALAQAEKYKKEFVDFANATHESVLKEVKELKEKLKELETHMNYSEMTVEEFFLARPDLKIDTENPKPWPQHLWEDSDEVNHHKIAH